MAHFIVEYSDNIFDNDKDKRNADIQRLFASLHDVAVDTGLFPYKGIRSRAYLCEQYRIADGNPQHGFVHLEVKLGAGRTLEERLAAAEKFYNVYCDFFAQQFTSRGMALSFEMKELDPVLKFNKNSIQDYL